MQAAVAAATAELADRYERGVVNERTATLYRRHLETFGRYLAAHDVTLTSEVTGRIVDAWVDAPISAVSPGSRGRAGQNPAEATRRNRQVSIRWALEVWAASGWIQPEVVPTRTLGRTASQAPCPVLPAEARRLRVAGQHSPADTLLPALVALGLSGLNHTEIARLTLDSYDPDTGRLTVVGRGGRRTREIALDPVARRAPRGARCGPGGVVAPAVAPEDPFGAHGVAVGRGVVDVARHRRPRRPRPAAGVHEGRPASRPGRVPTLR